MTRGRPPGKTTKPDHPVPNQKALAKASAALTEMNKRSAEVAERFADGLPYDRERVVAEAKYMMSQSAEAMLEAGKRLIQIKENEPWGDFTQIVERQLGLNERTARVMMQAAVKYLSPALESKRQTFAVLGKSKLFDLMVESDEDLAQLAEGGTVAGLDLDDLQSMSVRELREALADERKTRKGQEKLLSKRATEITELKEAAEHVHDEAVMHQALSEAGAGAQVAMLKLAKVANEAMNKYDEQGLDVFARQTVDYVARVIANLAVTHGITVDLNELVSAPWVTPADGAKKTRKGG